MRTAAGAVPVLMYHSVGDTPTRGTRALAVRAAAFERQLAVLGELGRSTVTMAALLAHWRRRAAGLPSELPPRPIVLTFDDGYEDFHSVVLPALRRHHATATLYVTTGWLADAGRERAGRPLGPMLSWGQLAEIAGERVELGGHSHSHPQLDQLRQGPLRDELARNRGLLEQALGQRVVTFAHPFGYSSRRVREAVRTEGYLGACAVGNALASPEHQGPYEIRRMTVGQEVNAEDFGHLVQGRGIDRHYAADRLLSKGYAVCRRTRQAIRTVAGAVPDETIRRRVP